MALKSGILSKDETISPASGDDQKTQFGAITARWPADAGTDAISNSGDEKEAAVSEWADVRQPSETGSGTVQQDEPSQNTTTNSETSFPSRESYCCDKGTSTSHSQHEHQVFQEPTPPVPPDGGYGWVIVFCGFMVNLLVDGMCYMGGMLYIELLEYFQQPKGKTQWVHTLVPAVYLLTGPFVGALVNTFGCRIITIIGSIIASTFFLISSIVPTVEVLILTYGIMIGIGFGFMYLPAVCFVSYYFDRRRAMATGIAVCGSGIGTFIFPPFMNFLLSLYGWRGSLMILAGISLHCCIFGALMRPLVASTPKKSKKEKELEAEEKKQKQKKKKKQKSLDKYMEQRRSIIMQKIIEQKKRQRTISSGSLDGSVITKDNKLVKDPDLLRIILELETQNKLAKNDGVNVSNPEVSTRLCPRSNTNCNSSSSSVSRSLQTSCADLDSGLLRKPDRLDSVHGESRSDVVNSAPSLAELERRRKDMARIMYRQDIFYTGSITSISEYKSNPDLEEYTHSVVSVPISTDGGATGSCAPFTNILNQMFDLSLFKSVTFIVLISSAFLSFLGFFVPFMFIPDLAKMMGASGNQAALLISVLGACNAFARLGVGWLADRPWADSLVIQNVALITGGLATAMVPLFVNYALLAAYCCVFGICMAMFIALRSIVTAEMMGVQKLNNAFGLTIFFQGVAGTAGSPLAGTIFDVTGSYTVSFIIAGAFIALSGVICLPLRRIAAWEKSKMSPDQLQYHVVAAEDPLPDPTDSEDGAKVQFSGCQMTDASGAKC